MFRLPWLAIALTLLWASAGVAQRSPQGKEPHIGYIYPAGGQFGTEFEVTVGGQNLASTSDLLFSGAGVQATVIDHFKVFSQGEANRLRNKLDVVRQSLEERDKDGNLVGPRAKQEDVEKKAVETGVATQKDFDAYAEYQRRRNDKKRQPNPQLDEWVTAKIKVAADAVPGRRFIRVRTESGLSNPLVFYTGHLPEYYESEPNDRKPGKAIEQPLPVVINGQVMPGDVDHFRFEAERGDRLVVTASARNLVPYLADAVPGWFQATLALYDASGHEVAFVDDYEFHPDPVLFYKIPKDGEYDLEIRDAIYRGREDFVYRITVGEIPFLTSVYPAGRQSGHSVTVEPLGWNLPARSIEVEGTQMEPGVYSLSMQGRRSSSNSVPFAVDLLPDCLDQEPNNDPENAQKIKPPIIVNGRIDQAGDWDVYRFEGRAGGKVILEVRARRLNSPLDSYLRITTADGRTLAFNDDHEDKGSGLTTHHADSFLLVDLPADGSYFVHLGDTQNKGGPEYVYRLRISARQPDFSLRVAPSTLNVRPGASVPVSVFALRHDDFADEIKLELRDAPKGITLRGDTIAAGKDEVELRLSAERTVKEEPLTLDLVGHAIIKDREVRRTAVPADDWMQAFIYHHLVPADDLLVCASDRAVPRKSKSQLSSGAAGEVVRIPAGGFARYQVALPQLDDLDQVKVKIVQPSAGITIPRVVAGPGGLVMLLSADANILQPGDEGDLVLEMYIETGIPGAKGGKMKRKSVGSIPPIRYQISG